MFIFSQHLGLLYKYIYLFINLFTFLRLPKLTEILSSIRPKVSLPIITKGTDMHRKHPDRLLWWDTYSILFKGLGKKSDSHISG